MGIIDTTLLKGNLDGLAESLARDPSTGFVAPRPLRYWLSSLAFCQQVWYAKGAAIVGCEVVALEINVETFMDMRGEHLIDEIPTHPQWFLVTALVDSPSPSKDVEAMAEEANSRCPVYGLLSRAVPIYNRLLHNGVVLKDAIPPGPPDGKGKKERA